MPRSLAFVLLVTAFILPSCQRDEVAKSEPGQATTKAAKPAASDDAYKQDVDNICNAEEKSGALDLDEGSRQFHVAQWLGSNIKTQSGREFLASLSSADPKGKVSLLQEESKRLGLPRCALIAAWSGGESD